MIGMIVVVGFFGALASFVAFDGGAACDAMVAVVEVAVDGVGDDGGCQTNAWMVSSGRAPASGPDAYYLPPRSEVLARTHNTEQRWTVLHIILHHITDTHGTVGVYNIQTCVDAIRDWVKGTRSWRCPKSEPAGLALMLHFRNHGETFRSPQFIS